MKLLTSAALGAIALATTLSVAEPAAARSDVGVYVGPNGVAVSIDRYKEYCRDYSYRERHWDRCNRYYGHVYRNDYERHDYGRHHGRYRHWDRDHRRWYWDDNRW